MTTPRIVRERNIPERRLNEGGPCRNRCVNVRHVRCAPRDEPTTYTDAPIHGI